MKLNALDIRKQEFSTRFRGYDPEEVNGFLQMVAQQWQELTEDLRRLEQRIDEQSTKLGHYMKVEEALEQALETAREGARQRLETADQRATATVEDAERRARSLLAEAESRAASTLESSEKRSREMLADAQRRASELVSQAESREIRAVQQVADASLRRSEIVSRLRAFLATEMELLGSFDDQPEVVATSDRVASSARVTPPSSESMTGAFDEPSTGPSMKTHPRADSAPWMPTDKEDAPGTFAPPPEPVVEHVPVAASPASADDEADATAVPPAESSAVEAAEPAGIPEEDSPVDDIPVPEESVETVPEEILEEAPTGIVEAVGPVADEVEEPESTVPVEDPSPVESKGRKAKGRTTPVKQVDLLDDSAEYGGASDEIRKIRRILEDLDR